MIIKREKSLQEEFSEVEPCEIPIDATGLTNDAICELAKNRFLEDGRSTGPKDYYCGITNNIEDNRARHNVPHLAVFQCKDAETAAEVEEMLGEYFDIGDPVYKGNGGKSNSVYVYLCYKSSGFKY